MKSPEMIITGNLISRHDQYISLGIIETEEAINLN